MSRHPASLRKLYLGRAPHLAAVHRSEHFRECRLALVKTDGQVGTGPGRDGDLAPIVRPQSTSGVIGDRRGWLPRALRWISGGLTWDRSRRASVLNVQSLSEHLRRDLGLTHHVEQPTPRRR